MTKSVFTNYFSKKNYQNLRSNNNRGGGGYPIPDTYNQTDDSQTDIAIVFYRDVLERKKKEDKGVIEVSNLRFGN